MESLMMRVALTGIGIGSLIMLYQGNLKGALAGAGLIALAAACDHIGKKGWLNF